MSSRQRKGVAIDPEIPLGRARPVGSLEERIQAFSSETGFSPQRWLTFWDKEQIEDSSDNMRRAIAARGLWDESGRFGER